MTPDKEHAPVLMQQAADEAVALVARLIDHSWGKNVTDTLQQWTRDREQAADTITTLTAQLAAAAARVAIAAEDERDRLYRKANADYIAAEERGDTIAQEGHSAAAYWLNVNGGTSETDRAAIRALADQHKPAEEPMP